MTKKTVKDLKFAGKRVIMRVDFNVPLKNGVIQDDIRMRAALPTINYILDQKPKYLVLMSHLGDPKKDTQKAKEKAEKDGKPFDEASFWSPAPDLAFTLASPSIFRYLRFALGGYSLPARAVDPRRGLARRGSPAAESGR